MRYFLAVVDHGGVTRAARELYISQPSLSQAIRVVESQFDTPLFDRVGRELRPTADGLALAESLRSVLEMVDDATERVKRVVDLEAGRLTIAAASTLAIHPLAAWIERFLTMHPGVQVHVRDVGTTSQAVSALRSGSVDLALVEPPVSESSVFTHRWRAEELLIAGTVAPLPTMGETIPAAHVAKIPFGIVSRHEGGHSASLRTITGLLGDIRATCSDREFLWELVAAGAVATFVSRETAELVLPGVPLRHVNPPVMREIALAHRDRYPPPAVAAFLSLALSPPADARAQWTKAVATSDNLAGS